MSDYNVYAGPVAVCKISYGPTTTEGCANKACSAYGNRSGGKFCNQCAQPYGEVPSRYPREVVEWRGVVGEAMFSETVDGNKKRVFMPNQRRNEPREMLFDPSDEVFVPMTPAQVDSERRWFLSAFGEEVAKLRAAYGEDNLSVEWLILSWYS